MIQINLLPSIKAEYVKAQRTKRTVISVSVIAIAISLGIVGILASVAFGAQQLQLSNLQKDIEKSEQNIKAVPDLDKILTIQNQLLALTPLHESKPVMSRVFTYLQQTTPEQVTIENYTIKNDEYAWTVQGNAPSLELVNKYVDTLKFTEIALQNESDEPTKAFSEVVLTSFTKTEDGYAYEITFKFNDQLFSSANPDIKLTVPSTVTTRSQTQLPSGAVFAPSGNQEGEGQ
jgi:Tfp pilus assembly protein PilN